MTDTAQTITPGDYVRIHKQKLTWKVIHIGQQADPLVVAESGQTGRRERFLLSQMVLVKKGGLPRGW